MNHERSPPSTPPQAKRSRPLACKRCRQRKQKCDESRPCSNCSKTGAECLPTEPSQRRHADKDYIQALEQRIAQLESVDPQQTLDRNRHGSTDSAPHNGSQAVPDTGSLSRACGAPAEESTELPQSPLEATDGIGLPRGVTPAGTTQVPTVGGISATMASPPSFSQSRTPAMADAGDNDMNYMLLDVLNFAGDGLGKADSTSSNVAGSPSTTRTRRGVVLETPSPETEEALLDAYLSRAQTQYPFLHFSTLTAWRSTWRAYVAKANSETVDMQPPWEGFFANLVYATAMLLVPRPNVLTGSQLYYEAGMKLLPLVFRHPDRVLHCQAYLLLSMYALHLPSSGRIMSLAAISMRYCVSSQLHLDAAELYPGNANIHFENQMRRRVFWSAYMLDRVVCSTFDIPVSVPDSSITVKVFANVEDDDLVQAAYTTPPGEVMKDSTQYTNISPVIHIVQVRRIQSEILSYTLHCDFASRFMSASDWRNRILAELINWKSQLQRYSETNTKGYTSNKWLAILYHYSLSMLYRPTKESVLGPAGDWSVQASSQACLIFRKSRMNRQIAQPWLGLLFQFQSGISLLYSFWATPPKYRTESYDHPDVSDALRACSNTLAITADQSPEAECIRDTFELLVREIPLIDRPNRTPQHLSVDTVARIKKLFPEVRRLVNHLPIIRMIDEMVNEDFPRASVENLQPHQQPEEQHSAYDDSSAIAPNGHQPHGSQPQFLFEMPFSTQNWQGLGNDGLDLQGFDTGFPAFPGVFDLDRSW